MGLTADTIEVIHAKDRRKAIASKIGGWGGAAGAMLAFNQLWAPVDLLGVPAWILHGVGELASGTIGYIVVSKGVEYVYELKRL